MYTLTYQAWHSPPENAIDDFDNFSLKNTAQLVNPMQWSPSPESPHHSKIENQKQVIGRSQICLLKRRYFVAVFQTHHHSFLRQRDRTITIVLLFYLRRVSFDIFKLVDTKNFEVKET